MINLCGYVHEVQDTYLYLFLNSESLDKLTKVVELTKSDLRVSQKIKINIRSCNINLKSINWSDVKDLTGIEIYCLCQPVKYCFTTNGTQVSGTYLKGIKIHN